jgi:hypothetical protein
VARRPQQLRFEEVGKIVWDAQRAREMTLLCVEFKWERLIIAKEPLCKRIRGKEQAMGTIVVVGSRPEKECGMTFVLS